MAVIVILLGVQLTQTNNPTIAHEDADTEENHMGTNETYQVVLGSNPLVIEPGQPFTLTLDILQKDGTTPVTKFDEVHTKLMHLILVSEDLSQFLHVHPDYQGNGEFVLKAAALPVGGNYVVFADFTPMSEHQQVVRLNLSTQDAVTTAPELAVGATEFVTDRLNVALDIPETLGAGAEQTIRFHVADAANGEPLNTLDDYLGAAGHLVIVDESGQTYLHTHPADHNMEDMSGVGMEKHYGPDLEFNTTFPTTGLYKMWLQVQYKGEIYTASFVIDVNAVAETTPEAVHGHG